MTRDTPTKIAFLCQDCGYSSPKWNGRCPACGAWGTLAEFAEPKTRAGRRAPAFRACADAAPGPSPLVEQPCSDGSRISTGIAEADRLLGGGAVAGSAVLLAGDPGVGKSTILMQAAGFIAESGRDVLYVSGEESGAQVRLRAERLCVRSPRVFFSGETDAPSAAAMLERVRPALAIVDSIQTLSSPDASSAAGSVVQTRECAQILIGAAKRMAVPLVMTGHVTKDGAIAGPRTLEHMVDVVLAMEGEPAGALRVLRCSKNRFGAANGVALLVGERDPSAPGSAVAVTMQGSRPLLCEVQALTNPSAFAPPRRAATGVDFNRMAMLTAVLSRRARVAVGNQDVLVNVPSGLHAAEPALDLAIATAIASSFLDAPIDPTTVVIGEVGLNSETRSVSHLERRLEEAARHGYRRAVAPESALRTLAPPPGIEVAGAANVRAALAAAIPGAPR